MDIDRTRYFCAFADAGSLVRASEILRISQPALSKALRTLEEEVGQSLVEPEGRGLRLTSEGRKFQNLVRPLLAQWLSVPERIRGVEERRVSRLGSFEVFTTYFLSQLLPRPEFAHLEVHELAPGKLEEGVAAGAVDFGVTYVPVPRHEVVFTETGLIRMGIFGRKELFGSSTFERLPFAIPLLPASGGPSKVVGLDGWPDHRCPRNVRFRVTLMESALELCRRGAAVAYLPEFVARFHNEVTRPAFALSELSCPLPKRHRKQPVFLIQRKGEPESRAAKRLAQALRALAILAVATLLSTPSIRADDMSAMMGPEGLWHGPSDCQSMGVWDMESAMCEPFVAQAMPMRMLMIHGNAFATRIWEQGPRAQDAWAVPNMVMTDLGTSWGDRHYLNLDLMLTAEKWLYPDRGYPLLLQIGETNQAGAPFIDDQHPHSSPIMGITISDTYSLGHEKDHLKMFFAPRGEATDGPIPFMHRTTGMVNPDAPLGHHIGQDVGHVSSTVFGASLALGATRIEASAYHGAEPKPEDVDLPLGTPNSFSLRLIEEFSPDFFAMASAARVNRPEPDQPDIAFETRYSASAYWQRALGESWTLYDTFIYGLVTQYDHANFLSSFAEEFLLKGESPRIWGRIEVLQRTPAELAIASAAQPNSGEWVAALTLGYTHRIAELDGAELGLGGSLTKDLLPGDLSASYGGDPWSSKVFLQLGGMKMWGF